MANPTHIPSLPTECALRSNFIAPATASVGLGPANADADLLMLGAPVAMAAGGVLVATAPEPLKEAIAAYRAGMDAFASIKESDWDRHGGEDAVIETTYGAPMRVLEQWQGPAVTREEAIEALRVVVEETENFWSTPMTGTMAMAALAYLENFA